jgi:AAA15 family ATPase/GTPase
MDFKLLGIRPLKNCSPNYLKSLEADLLYPFYAGFDADKVAITPEARTLILKSNLPNEFYDLKIGQNKLSLSVSAIVGKNGSGKSSLTDLLFVMIYNFSVERKILNNRKRKDPLLYEANIHAELFYQIGEQIYGLHMGSGEHDPQNRFKRITTIYRYKKDKKNEWSYDGIVKNQSKIIADYFFYSIAVNYSIYGLNSEHIGDWITSLFHKNDVYQTPIVINPFRDEGNININVENDLVSQRLLANILAPVADNVEPHDTLRNLANGKIANYLKLTLNQGKIAAYRKDLLKNPISNGIDCLAYFYHRYTGIPVLNYSLGTIQDDIAVYILNKLRKICLKYPRYRKFFRKQSFRDIDRYINRLIDDDSHITFKLRQAVNLLHYYTRIQQTVNAKGLIDIGEYAKFVREELHEQNYRRPNMLRPIEMIPPTIYDIDILFDEHHYFDQLSSGEKQKIHGINSIVYHLINLNSIFRTKSGEGTVKQNKYPYVNIIFDEIELYFHPDFQRCFISDLTEFIEKVNPQLVSNFQGLNMLFITHSPFILSDIATENVLYLEIDKKSGRTRIPETRGQTLGANIHDLLANEFFMENGFMGEYGRRKITSAIIFLKKNIDPEAKLEPNEWIWNQASVKCFIDLVGEPLIKKSLLDLYFRAFGKDAVQKEIDRLQKIMEGLST